MLPHSQIDESTLALTVSSVHFYSFSCFLKFYLLALKPTSIFLDNSMFEAIFACGNMCKIIFDLKLTAAVAILRVFW